MVTVLDTTGKLRPRHPEKAWRQPSESKQKPAWIRVRAPDPALFSETARIVEANGLSTVCQEAACPNIAECWQRRHATFMILGDICTRGCAFCNVATGKPGPVPADEARRVAAAVRDLALRHVVITSVNRDDLEDGGAGHFADVISEIRKLCPSATVEVLTPDFRNKEDALRRVLEAKPDVFNHNIETVPSLYRSIRPGARYDHSLHVLRRAKAYRPGAVTKSGLMLGFGEERAEVLAVMRDLRAAGVDILTLGQYLQPTLRHAEVQRFVPPEEFAELGQLATDMGFAIVSASPLTRSSHHAEDEFKALERTRELKT